MAEYTVYLYQTADFVGGLPDERNSAAEGRAPFDLTLTPDARMIAITIEDNEDDFGEEISGALPYITLDVTLNWVTYPAGTSIVTAYDLINTGTGHQVTSIHMGVNGRYQGPVDGLVTTQPMTPGVTYRFNRERTSYRQDNPYAQFVCFVAGTRILTRRGERPVEELKPGDHVLTRDNQFQPIRWIGSRQVAGRGDMAPVKIKAGALNALLGRSGESVPVPETDLMVSPQHRFMLRGAHCESLFGKRTTLVAAKHLINDETIRQVPRLNVNYFHLLFDHHEVIFANGAPAESFHPGVQGAGAIGADARAEILTLFQELNGDLQNYGATNAPALKGFEARLLIRRLLGGVRGQAA